MNKNILWTILLSVILICASQPSYGSILIGRINYVEGEILTYSEDEEDWVETGSNTPVGAEDGFYTDKDARAELVFPNDTMLRMGELTEVEVLNIEEGGTEIYIQNGIVRVYNHGPDTVVKVGTAMGYVEIPPQGVADFYVDDRSTEIVALQEDILFHKTAGVGEPETHQLRAGSNSLIFSVRHVETGTALADTPWNRWCLDRDMVLKEQAAIYSAHLPSSLQVYSHELEPYGEWERMRYRGYTYWFWRPVRVSVGWTPFTSGCWNRWHREYVWISTEPWGWCTHHYGNWVNLSGAWWWTPYIHMGVSFPGISLVNLNIHFGRLFKPFWHPGRIAWVSTTSHVGWIPLAPWETYYGYRKWGPRTVVVKYRDTPKSRNHYAYQDHSVFIPQKEFRRVNPNKQHDYRKLMVTGIQKKALLRDSKPTYGYHKMARVQQDAPKGRRDDRAKRQRTITKPNTFRSSTPPVRVSRERAPQTPEKKRALPRKETPDRITKVTKRPPLGSNNPKSEFGKPPQVSNARPPRNPVEKQGYSRPQDLKQTRPEQSARSMRGELSKPEEKTPLPRKETGDRITRAMKRPPRVTNNPKSGVNKSPQVSNARPPRNPVEKQGYSRPQDLKQTRPEQSVRKSSTIPDAQHIEKDTEPSNSGQSVMSQPSRNSQKWTSQESRQKGGSTGRNATPRKRRN